MKMSAPHDQPVEDGGALFGSGVKSEALLVARASSTQVGLTGWTQPFGVVVRLRYGSPAPGGSILMTSAPKSDIAAAAGPAI